MVVKVGGKGPAHIARKTGPATGGGPPSTAGQPIGLLLALTKAS